MPARSLLGLGRSYQISQVFHEVSALQNVMLAVQAHAGHSFSFFRPAATEAALIGPARAALEQVGLGARMHWIIHGVHHDHPNDPMRLVMPPAVSIPLGAVVFGVMYLVVGSTYAPGLGAGFFMVLDPRRHLAAAGCRRCLRCRGVDGGVAG